MILSKKQKVFSEIFATLLKSTSNFEHFEQKEEPHSWCASEIVECEIRGYCIWIGSTKFSLLWREYLPSR